MKRHILGSLAAGATLAAVAAPSALAQGIVCCRAVAPVADVLVVPPITTPFAIVNQGPVFSGPAIFVRPTYVPNDTAFAPYPFVYATGFYPPPGYAAGHYRRPSYRPRGGRLIGRRLPRFGVIDLRPRSGAGRPPLHWSRPSPGPAAPPPSHGRQERPPQPQTVPALRPTKPAEEQWTRRLPQ